MSQPISDINKYPTDNYSSKELLVGYLCFNGKKYKVSIKSTFPLNIKPSELPQVLIATNLILQTAKEYAGSKIIKKLEITYNQSKVTYNDNITEKFQSENLNISDKIEKIAFQNPNSTSTQEIPTILSNLYKNQIRDLTKQSNGSHLKYSGVVDWIFKKLKKK